MKPTSRRYYLTDCVLHCLIGFVARIRDLGTLVSHLRCSPGMSLADSHQPKSLFIHFHGGHSSLGASFPGVRARGRKQGRRSRATCSASSQALEAPVILRQQSPPWLMQPTELWESVRALKTLDPFWNSHINKIGEKMNC